MQTSSYETPEVPPRAARGLRTSAAFYGYTLRAPAEEAVASAPKQAQGGHSSHRNSLVITADDNISTMYELNPTSDAPPRASRGLRTSAAYYGNANAPGEDVVSNSSSSVYTARQPQGGRSSSRSSLVIAADNSDTMAMLSAGGALGLGGIKREGSGSSAGSFAAVVRKAVKASRARAAPASAIVGRPLITPANRELKHGGAGGQSFKI